MSDQSQQHYRRQENYQYTGNAVIRCIIFYTHHVYTSVYQHQKKPRFGKTFLKALEGHQVASAEQKYPESDFAQEISSNAPQYKLNVATGTGRDTIYRHAFMSVPMSEATGEQHA